MVGTDKFGADGTASVGLPTLPMGLCIAGEGMCEVGVDIAGRDGIHPDVGIRVVVGDPGLAAPPPPPPPGNDDCAPDEEPDPPTDMNLLANPGTDGIDGVKGETGSRGKTPAGPCEIKLDKPPSAGMGVPIGSLDTGVGEGKEPPPNDPAGDPFNEAVLIAPTGVVPSVTEGKDISPR